MKKQYRLMKAFSHTYGPGRTMTQYKVIAVGKPDFMSEGIWLNDRPYSGSVQICCTERYDRFFNEPEQIFHRSKNAALNYITNVLNSKLQP